MKRLPPLFFLLMLAPAFAAPDDAAAAHSAAIARELRCMVCEGQTVADSNAPLARDIRALIRRRIQAGDSDDAVKTYLAERYGDAILLRPPVKPETWLLWGAPLILLGAGGAVVFFFFRRGGGR
jgi:cytochrome c-type biogenesis protein CcmH